MYILYSYNICVSIKFVHGIYSSHIPCIYLIIRAYVYTFLQSYLMHTLYIGYKIIKIIYHYSY